VRPDGWEGYYVIHLDQPAIYHQPDGSVRDLPEIVELEDNFDIIDAAT
jgi:hypothetical protein